LETVSSIIQTLHAVAVSTLAAHIGLAGCLTAVF